MKIEYPPLEEDLLTHQLFLASQSKRIRKRRAQGKIFLLLIYMATGLFIWDRNGVVTGAIFFLVCLPLYFLYVVMEKRQYITHFRRSIQAQLKDHLTGPMVVSFEGDKIYLSDGVSENTIPQSELEIIHEIATLFSIHLKTGQSFYLPKSGTNADVEVPSFLRQLADRLEIPFNQDLSWKWK